MLLPEKQWYGVSRFILLWILNKSFFLRFKKNLKWSCSSSFANFVTNSKSGKTYLALEKKLEETMNMKKKCIKRIYEKYCYSFALVS